MSIRRSHKRYYSPDVRFRIACEAVISEDSTEEIAKKYNVSETSVSQWRSLLVTARDELFGVGYYANLKSLLKRTEDDGRQ